MTTGAPDDDHSGLLSELDSHDLELTMGVGEADSTEAFAFDAGADPDETFLQSVASGGPTPTGVILWTRVSPETFDPTDPLAVQVVSNDGLEDVIFE